MQMKLQLQICKQLRNSQLTASPCHVPMTRQKKAATELSVQTLCFHCKFCFRLGNERSAWPSWKLACHCGYGFFQRWLATCSICIKGSRNLGPAGSWGSSSRVWAVLALAAHLTPAEGAAGPPFAGTCWAGGRQVPCHALSKWSAWAPCVSTSCGT